MIKRHWRQNLSFYDIRSKTYFVMNRSLAQKISTMYLLYSSLAKLEPAELNCVNKVKVPSVKYFCKHSSVLKWKLIQIFCPIPIDSPVCVMHIMHHIIISTLSYHAPCTMLPALCSTSQLVPQDNYSAWIIYYVRGKATGKHKAMRKLKRHMV